MELLLIVVTCMFQSTPTGLLIQAVHEWQGQIGLGIGLDPVSPGQVAAGL